MTTYQLEQHFISLADWSPERILGVLELAAKLKDERARGVPHPILAGKTLAMIFQKSSTRTRVSFEVAMQHLGGHALMLSAAELQLGRGETVADTARVLSRYVDGIMARTYKHQDVIDLATHGSVPVINGLTDYNHPCQILADFLTLQEIYGPRGRPLKGLKLCYVGDGNNVCHSLFKGGAKLGLHVVAVTPKGYAPAKAVVSLAKRDAKKSGGQIEVAHELAAVKGADVIYTDVWASMGQEAEHAQRVKIFKGYQVNAALVRRAKRDAVVLHCLPAHRGEEITDEVVDGPHSEVFRQAENRLHAQKALLVTLLAD